MTVSITRIVQRSGDLQMHVGGCRDIARSHVPRHRHDDPDTITADTLLDAIVAHDTDSFSWFGQTAYEPDPDDVPWCVANIEWAPCFATAVKAAGIVFDAAPSGWAWDPQTGKLEEPLRPRGGTGRPSIPGAA